LFEVDVLWLIKIDDNLIVTLLKAIGEAKYKLKNKI
jgi:hypothetical protein